MVTKDVCSKIAIYGENREPLIFSSYINIDGDRITLLGRDFTLISHQTVVEAIGYFNNGISPIKGKVTLSTTTQLNLEVLDVGEKQERRDYIKVKTEIKATLLSAYALGKRKISFTLNAPIELRDISVGGVCFFCNSRLFQGQRVVLDLNQVKKGLVIEALILRTMKEHGKLGFRFRYGCKFIKVGSEEERILCEYAFKKEMEAHRKQKQLEIDE